MNKELILLKYSRDAIVDRNFTEALLLIDEAIRLIEREKLTKKREEADEASKRG